MPETSAEILFAWVHLSDLHVGRGEAGDAHGRRLVLGEVARDLARGGERSLPKLDAIFVTGDVAWTGAKSEYDEAREQLTKIADAAGLGMGSVFVVPGNHDVDRRADEDKYTKRLLKALRSGDKDESLDAALAEDGDRAALQKRLDPYLAFAAGLAPGCADLFWVRRFDARGVHVRLVGLNTALAAAEGAGKLWLGKKQIHDALQGRDDDELIVVLSHHPFRGGWLGDEKDANEWVRNHAHLHLFGHVKDADSDAALSGSRGPFVRIAAGAASAERGDHGYCVAAIVRGADGSTAVRVWPRRWSDPNKDFREDVDGVPRGERFAEHALRWIHPSEEEKERKGAKTQRRKKAIRAGAEEMRLEQLLSLAEGLQAKQDAHQQRRTRLLGWSFLVFVTVLALFLIISEYVTPRTFVGLATPTALILLVGAVVAISQYADEQRVSERNERELAHLVS